MDFGYGHFHAARSSLLQKYASESQPACVDYLLSSNKKVKDMEVGVLAIVQSP